MSRPAAYDALAYALVEVTAERDRARGVAVALEQRLTRVERLADTWEHDDAEHQSTWGHHYPASLSQLAGMLRDALDADQ